MAFVAGLWLILFGYALFYTGRTNLVNGGQGPSFLESLGLNSLLSSNIQPKSGTANSRGSNANTPSGPQPKAA